MSETILIADDEKEIADLVEVYLKNEGFTVRKFYNGRAALHFAENNPVDLAVLDVMLPDMDGFSIVQRLREHYMFPIILLTAKIGEFDKITGLASGADDYITKPFSPPELVARVRAQLRRFKRYNSAAEPLQSEKTEIDIRGLQISSRTHICILDDKVISLTPIEFNILWYLCSRKGEVISSEELFEAVWGEKYLDSSNTVMAHIARLREKMNEKPRHPKYIKTVWGVGYTIE